LPASSDYQQLEGRWPASTGWLIISVLFANKLWIGDVTSMSLYWVARLPIARPVSRSPLAPNKSRPASIAPSGNRRPRKIALSLAIVGALAAPFVFRTYKARPTYAAWVPLTAQERDNLGVYLRGHCRTETRDIGMNFICSEDRDEYEHGGKYNYYPSLPTYLALNASIAAATFLSIFVLAFLIPILVRGIALLVRRYWKWLNA